MGIGKEVVRVRKRKREGARREVRVSEKKEKGYKEKGSKVVRVRERRGIGLDRKRLGLGKIKG